MLLSNSSLVLREVERQKSVVSYKLYLCSKSMIHIMIYWITIVIVGITLLIKLWKSISNFCAFSTHGKNLPPGPFGLPILGSMPILAISPQRVLKLLGHCYGSVFTIYLGRYRYFLDNDTKLILQNSILVIPMWKLLVLCKFSGL